MDAQLSPAVGLISAYRFANDGSGRKLDPASLDQELTNPDGWVWLHFGLADQRCRDWLSRTSLISEAAREILLDTDEHIRLDFYGNEIVGVLPDLHQEFADEDADDLVRLHFVSTDRLFISARRRPLHSIEKTRRAIDAGRMFPTSLSFIEGFVDHFADVIERFCATLGDQLDKIENQVLHDEVQVDDQRMSLGKVRLRSIATRRQLSQIRSLFHRLETRADVQAKPSAVVLRSLAQKFDAIDYELSALYERARLLQDEITGRTAAITNRRLYTLSVLSACLLPATLVTGFFGMNTKDMPFQTGDGGTWYAAVAVIAAGAFTYWMLRRTDAL
ncbi:MAG: hypothetical protein A4S14_00335 [Proteobacteria bacterium SG_bin9]|nr:MAG: hypothetical protein A4S14_00335 [Proteobacteria bacterium SG_bin9]